MTEKGKRISEGARRNRAARESREAERKAQNNAVHAALLELVQDPSLTASERLRAVEALEKHEKRFLS